MAARRARGSQRHRLGCPGSGRGRRRSRGRVRGVARRSAMAADLEQADLHPLDRRRAGRPRLAGPQHRAAARGPEHPARPGRTGFARRRHSRARQRARARGRIRRGPDRVRHPGAALAGSDPAHRSGAVRSAHGDLRRRSDLEGRAPPRRKARIGRRAERSPPAAAGCRPLCARRRSRCARRFRMVGQQLAGRRVTRGRRVLRRTRRPARRCRHPDPRGRLPRSRTGRGHGAADPLQHDGRARCAGDRERPGDLARRSAVRTAAGDLVELGHHRCQPGLRTEPHGHDGDALRDPRRRGGAGPRVGRRGVRLQRSRRRRALPLPDRGGRGALEHRRDPRGTAAGRPATLLRRGRVGALAGRPCRAVHRARGGRIRAGAADPRHRGSVAID